MLSKKKIVNDPVYGFVDIPDGIIYSVLEHPWFQRLRRISQLGLTSLVYPGALHTRFHHALGAMHLMQKTLESLRTKNIKISDEEYEASCVAILLHDIGHGPYSHALENSIVPFSHEEISLQMMEFLNEEMNGKLSLAVKIFNNNYQRNFFHELISSQLDMDRLDYLRRDSFYTGVSEGNVGLERIIQMLNVYEEKLVVEEKGIYSVEKFIIARRLMYWQVYLHKTVIAAESLLINILRRAIYIAKTDLTLFATPTLLYFLKSKNEKNITRKLLENFAQLDDFDLLSAIKAWTKNSDKVLSILCRNLIDRKLPKIFLQNEKLDENFVKDTKKKISAIYNISTDDSNYFVYSGSVANSAYNAEESGINILLKNGTVTDLASASDQYNISSLAKPVVKYFLCVPKGI